MAEFLDSIRASLTQTATWLSILSGFWTTLRISALSLLFGTLLAAPLCALRMSRRRALSWLARTYIAIVRGTPVTMLLMLMYYVVFARSRIDAEIVATVAFAFNSAAVIAEIMRTALSAVQPGQIEAARALGMGRPEVFRSVIFPQALRIGLPVYLNATINLIQWTSVVNYIAVTDLSRAVNAAASRMMQPVLMLFVGILLYLLLAYAASGIFALIGRHQFGASYRIDRRQAS